MPNHTYTDPRVRDLAWALGSPPLLQRHDAGVCWVDSDWFENIRQDFAAQLTALNKTPTLLHAHLDNHHNSRLGHYFENLWKFWLANNPRYHLLHANLQVHDNKRTVGEFDFIVQDRHTGKTLHWEIALKFYLGTGDTTQVRNWWGPMRRDRLDIKTTHLLEHQSQLVKQPAAQTLLSELDINIDEAWIMLKGRLFYPLKGSHPPAADSHPQQLHGFWLPANAMEQLRSARWQRLDKSQWLSPLCNTMVDCLDTVELIDWWQSQQPRYPVCIAAMENGEEIERGFIVPANWGSTATQSL